MDTRDQAHDGARTGGAEGVDRAVVLVGLMGAGKTTVGRRLAAALHLPFVDADEEIERAADRSVSDIFEDFGETRFRDGERRVIARLLDGAPKVVATGGGAFVNEETRRLIKRTAVSVWLRADLDVLMERVSRRDTRPLLRGEDPRGVMQRLLAEREPAYREADITVDSQDGPHQSTVDAILTALRTRKSIAPDDARPAQDSTRHTVRVDLGERSYDVVIGPNVVSQAGQNLRDFAPQGRVFIIADATVDALHGEALRAGVSAAGLSAHTITVAPGEASKSFRELERLCEALLALAIERGETIAAFGGGVVGDLAGLAAAVINRGVNFVQIPTTVLAQVDSSVGGKTGVNTKAGKNLVGAFHQPRRVLADTALLSTLDERDRRAGFAEIIKIAMLADPDFFSWLEQNMENAAALDAGAVAHAIAQAVTLKARVVERDERESGPRALLNLGHTFGHAFEAEAGYASGLRHGEAVAAGMAAAARYAVALGRLEERDANRLTALICKAGLPTTATELAGAPFSTSAIFARMSHDKKNRSGVIRLVLPAAIGAAELMEETDPDRLRAFLQDICA